MMSDNFPLTSCVSTGQVGLKLFSRLRMSRKSTPGWQQSRPANRCPARSCL